MQEDQILAIKYDRHKGADELAAAALNVLHQAVVNSRPMAELEFMAQTRNLAQLLAGARPTMSAISTCMNQYLLRLDQYHAHNACDFDGIKTFAAKLALAMAEEIYGMQKKVAVNMLPLIPERASILTCSYSSTVIAVIVEVMKAGREVLTYAVRTYGGETDYAALLAQKLKEHQAACTPVEEDELEVKVKESDLVLIGADSVLPDGSVINGIPSLKVVTAASRRRPRLPVYVVCGSSKSCSEIPVIEPGFELIPACFITAIVTEKGIYAETR